MVPPSKPTSDPGVLVVVKSKVRATALLLSAVTVQLDVWKGPENASVSKADKPGKAMSMAVTAPLVTSTVSVPENKQVDPAAQEPRLPPEMLSPVPETSNVLMISALAAVGTRTAAPDR